MTQTGKQESKFIGFFNPMPNATQHNLSGRQRSGENVFFLCFPSTIALKVDYSAPKRWERGETWQTSNVSS